MAPVDDDTDEDTEWACPLCADVLLDPVTLPCCGGSFCQQCLRCWVARQAEASDAVRCPATGCNQKMPRRLPAISHMLSGTLEVLSRRQLQQRRQEEREVASSSQQHFGFSLWQEVAASRDLHVHSDIVVAFGTAGMIIDADAERLKVKFDSRVTGQGALRVIPSEVVAQLPVSFGVVIGQRVAASTDLMIGDRLVVCFATQGTVLKASGENRITVNFDGFGNLNVIPEEIQACRPLVGGFFIGNRVQASADLYANDLLLVRTGICGVIKGEHSDTRLDVQFDYREDGQTLGVNVLPTQIVRAQDEGTGSSFPSRWIGEATRWKHIIFAPMRDPFLMWFAGAFWGWHVARRGRLL